MKPELVVGLLVLGYLLMHQGQQRSIADIAMPDRTLASGAPSNGVNFVWGQGDGTGMGGLRLLSDGDIAYRTQYANEQFAWGNS